MLHFFALHDGPVTLIKSSSEVLKPGITVEFMQFWLRVRFFGQFLCFGIFFWRHNDVTINDYD